MAIPLEQFVRQLTESGLMSPEDLHAFVAAVSAEGQPRDGDQLARELVRQQKLTPFQAQAVYQGKGLGLVLGNYVILDKLGQGGMGAVFKAEHRRMRRVVALKVVSPAAMKSPDAVRRFVREVEAAAKLTHPNIVIAYDADEAAGKRFLVMEYVAGSDLSALVKKQGPLPVAKAVNCVLQAARGLQFAHEQGVIHRDIKPANLLVDGKGTVKILDMGLARLDSAGARQDDLTGTGQIMGTVDYMAPEQALNTKSADQRADVYSLGITLWFLLTGRAAYDGNSVVAKLLAHRDQATPSLREARPEVPAALDAVFAKMVAKKPDDRFQSMSAVIAALEGGGSEPVSAVTLPVARSDDSQLNDFLNGPPRTGTSPGGAVAPTQARQSEQTAVARDETISRSAVEADTDPQTQLRRPGAATRTPARKQTSAAPRPWWQDRRVPLGAGGLLAVLAWGLWAGSGPSQSPTPEPAAAAGNAKKASPSVKVKKGSTQGQAGQTEVAQKSAEETGWSDLPVGKSLAGWIVVGSPDWSARNGVLSASGAGKGWIGTARTFRDYELELEYKLPPRGNGGIGLRAWPEGGISMKPYFEIQILDDAREQSPYPTGSIKDHVAARPAPVTPTGQWHKIHARVQGQHVEVAVNGVPCVNANVPFERSAGMIGLQTWGTPLEYRRIRVRELESADAGSSTAPAKVAGAAPGWTELHDGKSLAGWTGQRELFASDSDGTTPVLAATGGRGLLWTDREFADFEIEFDFRIENGGNNGLGLRYAGKGDPAAEGFEIQILDDASMPNLSPVQICGAIFKYAGAKPGHQKRWPEWNQMAVRCVGPEVAVTLNGTVVTQANLQELQKSGPIAGLARTSGHICLFPIQGRTEFRAMRIREISAATDSKSDPSG